MARTTTTAARTTAASAHDRLDGLESSLADLRSDLTGLNAGLATLIARLTPETTARVTRATEPGTKPAARCKGTTKAGKRCQVRTHEKFCTFHKGATAPTPAPKKAAKKAPKKAPKATKGEQAVGKGALTTKGWNRTVTAKARFAGGATYRTILSSWDQVQDLRKQGMTPDQVLAHFAK